MYCLREPILAMLQSETTELDAEKLFRDLYPTKPVDPNSAESDPEVQKILTNSIAISFNSQKFNFFLKKIVIDY